MGGDRKLRDKIAHIAFALTIVGAIVLVGQKIRTGSFFLNSTERQKKLAQASKEIKRVIKP